MMFMTDDPAADYDRYCAELEQARFLLPECSECGKKIEDEFCYQVNDEIICEACMEKFRKYTIDLMG
jgi:hypothetical protein|nr:MAG TPA: hypothetical protein [Bacteriophage sp.]